MGNPFLYVARHGETQWNSENRIQGAIDIPLSDRGREQAALLAERFSGVPLAAIYSSPLSRALDTARIVAAAQKNGVEIRVDEDLLEVRCGIFEGKTYEELGDDRKWVKMWREDPALRLEGGESRLDLFERVGKFVARTLESHGEGESILIVGHGGVNKSIIGYLFDVSVKHVWRFYQANACVNAFRPHEMGYLCEAWNDVSHLPAGLVGGDQGAARK
jgi:broad specificity phosphatase PhoE